MRTDYMTTDEQRMMHRHRHTTMNHAVLALLRSPLHHLLDTELCELSYRGPRSGRVIALPVLYATDGADLVVLAGDARDKTWWRALRKPLPVRIRRGDAVRNGVGRVLAPLDPRYTAAVAAYERRHGMRPIEGERVVLIENLIPQGGTE